MIELKGRKLVLGVTGGVAAYKAAELVRLLGKAGADVHVVLTEGGARFVTAVTFQALSGNPVWTDLWDPRMANNMAHIDLTRDADAILIAPASADLMAKLVHGLADDLLTTLCLARDCPLLVAPAMNKQMWEHPATRRNALQLVADGVSLLGPAAGEQACGEVGLGRMLEPEALCEAVIAFFQPKLLAGRRIVMTAGPTFEPIDPVRGITNRSSGKMGFAIARAAAEAGAEVTLVAGPVHLPTPLGVRRIDVQSAQQMLEAVRPLAAQHQVFVATAAVADWRPAKVQQHKIKKNAAPGEAQVPGLALAENADILATIAALPHPPLCVGFAAESQDLVKHAREKLVRKKVPLIVANLGPATFGQDDNAITLVDARGERELSRADKLTLARELVREIAQRLTTYTA